MDDSTRRMSEETRGRGDDTIRDYAGSESSAVTERSPGYTSQRDLDDDTERRTRQIRSDIARTRGDMSETIDAIQGKLSPGNLVSEATDRMKNAASERVSTMASSVGRTAENAMESTRRTAAHVAEGARENVVPIMLIGIGAAWLFANRRQNGQERWPVSGVSSTRGMDEGNRHAPGGDALADRFQHLLRSNPVMVGVAGLAVGAAVGLLLPETERENEWLGESRDQLVDKAQDAVRTAATQVREAAGDLAGQVANQVVSGRESTE